MHNIDRTNLEAGYGEYPGEYGGTEFGYEAEGDREFETYGEYSQESPFSEAEEMELASELLTVSNEAELEQFLGKLFKKAGRAVGGFIKSPVGRSLMGTLKGVAKQALPTLGGLAGNFLLPGIGGQIGSQLGSAAGGMLGLELEGMSQEDQEFEVAKQLVRLGGAAASNAAQAPPSAPPMQTVQTAVTAAAQQYAPGLLSQAAQSPATNGRRCSHKQGGRWVHIKRGNKCVIVLEV